MGVGLMRRCAFWGAHVCSTCRRVDKDHILCSTRTSHTINKPGVERPANIRSTRTYDFVFDHVFDLIFEFSNNKSVLSTANICSAYQPGLKSGLSSSRNKSGLRPNHCLTSFFLLERCEAQSVLPVRSKC